MKTKTLLVCGAVAGPLFVVAFVVEGATRAGYDPVRYPVSLLAVGDFGWVQVVNFIVTGLLMLALAVGLRLAPQPLGGSTWGPLLVGVYAIGLLGAGIFVTDPVAAYPPGASHQIQPSLHSTLHDLSSVVVLAALPAACLVFSRRFAARGERGWATYSAGSGVVFAVGFILASAGFNQAETLIDVAGLLQRIAIAVGWGWLALLAVHLLRLCAASKVAPG